MLDDIVVAARVDGVPLVDGIPDGMLPLDRVRGRPDVWGIARHGGRLFVTYCPSTRIVSLRISVPRWMHGGAVNFPLVPVRSVEDLRPRELSLQVAWALGFKVSAIGSDAERLIPIRSWPVTRSSHAVDLSVSDPRKCVLGCLGLDRRHAGAFAAFGNPISTVQWGGRALRSKFYAKGLEIESHRARTEEEALRLEEAATSAKHALRFEVSFRQVRAVRDLFGGISNGGLPTLAVMCDPEIDSWVLAREARRLRLFDELTELQRATFPGRVRHVGSILLDAQRQLTDGTRARVGRRRTVTSERIWDLAAAFFLGSAYSLDELRSISGRSRSALAELLSELRELGIPPDDSPFGSLGSAVREIAEALRPHLVCDEFPDLSAWTDRGGFVAAPWDDGSERDDEDDDEVSMS